MTKALHCEKSIKMLENRCETFFSEKYLSISPLLVDGVHNASTLFNSTSSDVDIVFFGGIIRKFCELPNWRFNKARLWVLSSTYKKILIDKYPHIDFSRISDDHLVFWEEKYNPDHELERLKKRIEDFKNIVKTFNEDNIAIVSHSSYLGQMMFNKIESPSSELYHCHPYKFYI